MRCAAILVILLVVCELVPDDSPGEKMSGLKRMSNDVLLMEPTALQAFRTTSRLLGSVCEKEHTARVRIKRRRTHHDILNPRPHRATQKQKKSVCQITDHSLTSRLRFDLGSERHHTNH